MVATVLAMGPGRVWDALTLRTVEEFWPNGQIKCRYALPFWESVDEVSFMRAMRKTRFDSWHENGQMELEIRHTPTARMRGWTETGRLNAHVVAGTGIQTTNVSLTGFLEQLRWRNGEVVERRTAPPWFTEEEILQSVEGVEE